MFQQFPRVSADSSITSGHSLNHIEDLFQFEQPEMDVQC